jgi:ABC-type Fe3+ transport system permease subunit
MYYTELLAMIIVWGGGLFLAACVLCAAMYVVVAPFIWISERISEREQRKSEPQDDPPPNRVSCWIVRGAAVLLLAMPVIGLLMMIGEK